MIAKFNPTGTHIYEDFLKVRIDLYPEVGDKTYPIHYVDHYDREPTQKEEDNPTLLALIPTHKEVNPCLCHFLTIDPSISLGDLAQYIKITFDKQTLNKLDNILSSPQINLVQLNQLMNLKLGNGKEIVQSVDIAALNHRLSSLEVNF